MKKRILAGFLALVLATLYCAVGLTEEDMNSFDATVMPVFDRTADNWYRSAENRAMFTVLAALEYMMSVEKNLEIDWTKTTYVGILDDIVMAMFATGDDRYIAVMYNASLSGQLHYVQIEGTSSLVAELTLEKVCDTFETNQLGDLVEALEMIQEIAE